VIWKGQTKWQMSLKFCNKNFQPNAYQMKFSRKLPGKRVRRHINKVNHFKSSSVHKPYPCMFAVAYESSGQPLPQVSEEGHSRSSPALFEAPQLLMAYLPSL